MGNSSLSELRWNKNCCWKKRYGSYNVKDTTDESKKGEWGVHKLDLDKNGDLNIKKGTIVKRISLTRNDPTYDNKKYVSINQEDHSKWSSYLGEGYIKRNKATFDQTYILNKDLKIMSAEKQGKLFVDMMMESKAFRDIAIRDVNDINQEIGETGLHGLADASESISRNIAFQTETGKRFVERVKNLKYDALFDTHGTNVSENPIIVLNPDDNMTNYKEPEYSEPVKRFYEKYGIAY